MFIDNRVTHFVAYIETIKVQTDPFTIQAHIYVCHGNLLKWATSLNMSSQMMQINSKLGFVKFVLNGIMQATGMTKISRGGGIFEKFSARGGYFTGSFEFWPEVAFLALLSHN